MAGDEWEVSYKDVEIRFDDCGSRGITIVLFFNDRHIIDGLAHKKWVVSPDIVRERLEKFAYEDILEALEPWRRRDTTLDALDKTPVREALDRCVLLRYTHNENKED